MNFLSCHGPLGVDQVAVLTHRGQDRRHMKKQGKNKHKWQEVTKDNEAFISRSVRGTEWGAHRVSTSSRGETVDGVLPPRSRESGWQDRPDPSVHHPSIHPSIHQSRRWGRVKDMKRPHDYSSPDSDTDEFIDVGQEDSFWWASANHTWGCSACLQITLQRKMT